MTERNLPKSENDTKKVVVVVRKHKKRCVPPHVGTCEGTRFTRGHLPWKNGCPEHAAPTTHTVRGRKPCEDCGAEPVTSTKHTVRGRKPSGSLVEEMFAPIPTEILELVLGINEDADEKDVDIEITKELPPIPEEILELLRELEDEDAKGKQKPAGCTRKRRKPLVTCHCTTCGENVALLWDARKDGIVIHCPHCGGPIILWGACSCNDKCDC